MIVPVQNSFWISVCILVAGQLPDDDSLVYSIYFRIRQLPANKLTLPRDAVKIMSGFSEEVAIAVTHPLWPSNEPRNLKDSVILWMGELVTPLRDLRDQCVTVTVSHSDAAV